MLEIIDLNQKLCYDIRMEKRYYKHKIKNLLVVQKIVTIHYIELDKDFVSASESHDFWELVYADKKSLVCTANGRKILLEEGEILFHKPNEQHSLAANGVNAANVFVVCFECKSEAVRFFEEKHIRLDKQFRRFIYPIVEESKNTFDLPCFEPELKKMKLLNHPALGGEQLIKNYLEILLVNIMRNETDKKNSDAIFLNKKDYVGRISKDIVKFLTENLYSRLTIDDICEKLNYNKSYLFRQFKADTGSSIMTYFSRLKIEKAKQLLLENEWSVTQIAVELSFDSPNYFSKTFKKITGYTPLQYRKIHKK